MNTLSHRQEPWRPQFHFTPEKNWINDPNGLVWFEGEYHLFYQYNPFGDQWGHMSWGHAVSSDLLHWQELPVAIPEDARASIFSGSVVVDKHNSSGFGSSSAPPLVAIYTGCLRRDEGGQAQELAYSTDRGRTWTKYSANPVLDLNKRDFRDPKVFWHESTARWVMAVVLPDERKVAFYASANLKNWSLLSYFSAPVQNSGIWECPDLIELTVAGGGTHWMLKVDVFEGHPSGAVGGSGARTFFGHFDGTQFIADQAQGHPWPDHGSDFYAALSWANLPDEQNRTVWLAWMSAHRYAKQLPTAPWRGAMSVPRELHLQRTPLGMQLVQRPVRELAALRHRLVCFHDMSLSSSERSLLPITTDARTLDIELTCDMTQASEFGLLVHAQGTQATRVGYNAERGTVFVDRGQSGFLPDDALYAQRREVPCPAPVADAPLQLRVLLDWSSVEVFVGGEGDDNHAVISEQVFPMSYSGDDSPRALAYSEGGDTHFKQLALWTLISTHKSPHPLAPTNITKPTP